MKSPNILLLMSDQHTASLMGCAGAVFVRTPHLGLPVLPGRGESVMSQLRIGGEIQ
jgi:hypothetical protein